MYSMKLLTKPVIQFIKNQEKKNPNKRKTLSKPFFIFIGNLQYRIDLWINKRVLGIKTDDEIFVKKINDDVALSEGVQFFWEIMTYILLLTLTAYEYNKYNNESEESKRKLNERLQQIESDQKQIKESLNEILVQQNTLRNEMINFRDQVQLYNLVQKELDKYESKK